MEDVESRRVWSLSTGKVIDECRIDEVTDEVMNRKLPAPDDIRVELTVKNALKMFKRGGPDVVDILS